MSESRVQEVVESRLMAFNLTEYEVMSVSPPDSKGLFEVRVELLPIVGKRYGSIATQANALAVQAISALNTVSDDDVDCGMSSCTLQPLSGTSERPVLALIFKFGVLS